MSAKSGLVEGHMHRNQPQPTPCTTSPVLADHQALIIGQRLAALARPAGVALVLAVALLVHCLVCKQQTKGEVGVGVRWGRAVSRLDGQAPSLHAGSLCHTAAAQLAVALSQSAALLSSPLQAAHCLQRLQVSSGMPYLAAYLHTETVRGRQRRL